MCGNNFKKFDHIDCKRIAFKVKKRAFLHPAKLGSIDFEFSWLNFFPLLKFFFFTWGKKNSKMSYFHSLKDL
jgi:hypothetical protein